MQLNCPKDGHIKIPASINDFQKNWKNFEKLANSKIFFERKPWDKEPPSGFILKEEQDPKDSKGNKKTKTNSG